MAFVTQSHWMVRKQGFMQISVKIATSFPYSQRIGECSIFVAIAAVSLLMLQRVEPLMSLVKYCKPVNCIILLF